MAEANFRGQALQREVRREMGDFDRTVRSEKRGPKPKPKGPIETAIASWLDQLPTEIFDLIISPLNSLVSSAPKRWVVYPPMVLLPSGSFDAQWFQLIANIPTEDQDRENLWFLILHHISKREGKGELTHLAINSGIPLHQRPSESSPENIFRTPSGLITLHGDFGPALSPDEAPTEEDFEEAFWVSTKQNGITQIWAPRYTMFSRGNIKEKARILEFHDEWKGVGPPDRFMEGKDIEKDTAVDLYAGIGYFVFSYAKMGMKRVVGWELNPWSVEGLRRGAMANGWSIKVLRPGDDVGLRNEKIVVFLENNREANHRKEALGLESVQHVNCGLLPASEDSWQTALAYLDGSGWLHLHENVGVDDIEARRRKIERTFAKWLHDDPRSAHVEHVEQVKTFAPGVWHCVFDVLISYCLEPSP